MPIYTKTYKTVPEYINSFNGEAKNKLKEMQSLLKQLLPKGEEAIKYGIPTVTINGKNVVHYGAYKNHFAFYPASKAIEVFKKDLASYKTSKGTIKFSLDKPLPKDLITEIVNFRLLDINK